MIKNIFKSIVFILILFALLWCVSVLLVNIRNNKKNKISTVGISDEKANSIDYFVLGDSETYTSIIPLEIWHDYGYTGYILGTSAQRLKETKEILIENLINQKPKVLILEINTIFRKNRQRNKGDYVLSFFMDLYKYHDNWKFLVDENFQTYSGNEKGYIYSVKIKKSLNKNYIKETEERTTIPDENISYIEDIIDICKQNDIKIIFLSTPSTKNWNYKRHNSIEDLSKNYDIQFADFNLDDNVVIDWDKDTQDEGDHLNYYGALKVTKRLGAYLYDLNVLDDHRDEDYYKEWHNNYNKYKLKFNNE